MRSHVKLNPIFKKPNLASLVKEGKKVEIDMLTEEEKVEEFNKLLQEIGVSGTWRWEDANRILQSDSRAKILKTIHSRKTTFHNYITMCKQRERQEARNKRLHVKNQPFF